MVFPSRDILTEEKAGEAHALRLRYRFSDFILLVVIVATSATTSNLAGKDISIWTLKIGSVTGGSIALLGASNFRSGMLIVLNALLGSMVFSITAAILLGYDPFPVETVEKTPIDYPTLMLFGFIGAALGASTTAVLVGEFRWKREAKV